MDAAGRGALHAAWRRKAMLVEIVDPDRPTSRGARRKPTWLLL